VDWSNSVKSQIGIERSVILLAWMATNRFRSPCWRATAILAERRQLTAKVLTRPESGTRAEGRQHRDHVDQ